MRVLFSRLRRATPLICDLLERVQYSLAARVARFVAAFSARTDSIDTRVNGPRRFGARPISYERDVNELSCVSLAVFPHIFFFLLYILFLQTLVLTT